MWLDGYIAVASRRVTRTEVAQAHELYLQNMFIALFIIIGFILHNLFSTHLEI